MAVIQMADGTYGPVYLGDGWVGGGVVQFLGNTSDINGVTIDAVGTTNPCFFNLDPVRPVINIAWVTLRNKVGGNAIDLSAPIKVRLWNQVSGGGQVKFYARSTSVPMIMLFGEGVWLESYLSAMSLDYTDSASSQRSFLDADGLCFANWQNIDTITGAPDYSDGFFKLTGGQYNHDAGLSSNAVGNRCTLNGGGTLLVYGAGLECVPGNLPPLLNGGIYIDAFCNTEGEPDHEGQTVARVVLDGAGVHPAGTMRRFWGRLPHSRRDMPLSNRPCSQRATPSRRERCSARMWRTARPRSAMLPAPAVSLA
jgi:hypothetical protein